MQLLLYIILISLQSNAAKGSNQCTAHLENVAYTDRFIERNEMFRPYLTRLNHGLQNKTLFFIGFDYDNLEVVLNMIRGVLSNEGKVIEKPLNKKELEDFLQNVFPVLSRMNGLMKKIFIESNQNPKVFYTKTRSFVHRMLRSQVEGANYLSPDENQLLRDEYQKRTVN